MINNDICNQLSHLLISPYLWTAVAAYIGGQVGKVLIQYIKHQPVKPSDLFASGNMPSTHAASAFALTTTIGYINGFDSAIFVLALMVAAVISYDACHVRRAVGEQGLVIQALINNKNETELLTDLNKELVIRGDYRAKKAATNKQLARPYFSRGHLGQEVIAGAIFGVVIGLVIPALWAVLGIIY